MFVIFDREKEQELEQEKSRRKELEQRYKVSNEKINSIKFLF